MWLMSQKGGKPVSCISLHKDSAYWLNSFLAASIRSSSNEIPAAISLVSIPGFMGSVESLPTTLAGLNPMQILC